jgi:hypothetical protein
LLARRIISCRARSSCIRSPMARISWARSRQALPVVVGQGLHNGELCTDGRPRVLFKAAMRASSCSSESCRRGSSESPTSSASSSTRLASLANRGGMSARLNRSNCVFIGATAGPPPPPTAGPRPPPAGARQHRLRCAQRSRPAAQLRASTTAKAVTITESNLLMRSCSARSTRTKQGDGSPIPLPVHSSLTRETRSCAEKQRPRPRWFTLDTHSEYLFLDPYCAFRLRPTRSQYRQALLVRSAAQKR